MENEHVYDVSVKWERDRMGTMASPVLTHSFEVATPPDFYKGMPGIWSPEHLLVASVNSCLMATFLGIAENFKLHFVSFSSNATGKVEKVEGKFMMTEISLFPTVVVAAAMDTEKAEKVLQKSEAACLISNSIKSTIVFKPTVVCQ